MVTLCILDGFGIKNEELGNAILAAGTPNLDKLKKEYPHIELICAVPYEGQQELWKDEYKKRWENIISQSDEIVYTSNKYTKSCFHKRNRYIVDVSNAVVCCFDGTSGGTAYTVDYALKKHKLVIQINPHTCKVEIINKQ